MLKKRNPYHWRTFLRGYLPSFILNLGVADKGEDCEKLGAEHVWYNIDGKNSGCYHCKIVRPGKLWEKS